MTTLKKAILQDLLDDNATIGPDGGIWYPSSPEETYTLASLLVELVAPREVLNKKALKAVIDAANIDLRG